MATDEGTVALVDNDVVANLAPCGLLQELAGLVNAESVQVRGAMRFQMVDNPTCRWRRRLDEDTREAIRSFLLGCEEISDEIADPEFIEQCQDAGIDDGEAILLDLARNDARCVLVTGDKRFLTCLAADPGLMLEVRHMRHQFLCFEQLVHCIIDVRGFDHTRSVLQPLLDRGHGIRVLFVTEADDPETNCREGLGSWIGEVHKHLAELLAPVGIDGATSTTTA